MLVSGFSVQALCPSTFRDWIRAAATASTRSASFTASVVGKAMARSASTTTSMPPAVTRPAWGFLRAFVKSYSSRTSSGGDTCRRPDVAGALRIGFFMAKTFGTGGQTGRNNSQCVLTRCEHCYKQSRPARQRQQHLAPLSERVARVIQYSTQRIIEGAAGLVEADSVFGAIRSRFAFIPFKMVVHLPSSWRRRSESGPPRFVRR